VLTVLLKQADHLISWSKENNKIDWKCNEQ